MRRSRPKSSRKDDDTKCDGEGSAPRVITWGGGARRRERWITFVLLAAMFCVMALGLLILLRQPQDEERGVSLRAEEDEP